MENREIFSQSTTIPPVFVRLDGRAFHRLDRDSRPRKSRLTSFSAHAMVHGLHRARCRERALNPDFAFTFSDEISLYFTQLPFNGRVEKIDSVAASFAASSLTLALGGTTPLSIRCTGDPGNPGICPRIPGQPAERGLAQPYQRLLPAGADRRRDERKKSRCTALRVCPQRTPRDDARNGVSTSP